MGIEGNERAGRMAKAGCRVLLLAQITGGGICAQWKDIQGRKWAVSGLGTGRVVRWYRRAVLRYTQLHVGRGDVRVWRRMIGA